MYKCSTSFIPLFNFDESLVICLVHLQSANHKHQFHHIDHHVCRDDQNKNVIQTVVAVALIYKQLVSNLSDYSIQIDFLRLNFLLFLSYFKVCFLDMRCRSSKMSVKVNSTSQQFCMYVSA